MQRSFISCTKRELNICALLGTWLEVTTFLRITTLKKSCTSDAEILFWLDIVYWEDSAFASLLVNVSSLFDTILTCSRCFLGCLQLCSTSGKDVKGTNKGVCIGATDIKNTYAKDTYAKNISTRSTCAGNAYIWGASTGSTCIRVTCIGVACVWTFCIVDRNILS